MAMTEPDRVVGINNDGREEEDGVARSLSATSYSASSQNGQLSGFTSAFTSLPQFGQSMMVLMRDSTARVVLNAVPNCLDGSSQSISGAWSRSSDGRGTDMNEYFIRRPASNRE